MNSYVSKNRNKCQTSLIFGCLIPEEAHKIMDVLFEEDMDEFLGTHMFDIDLAYCVNGYRPGKDGKKIWSHDLDLFIEGVDASGLSEEEQNEVLEYDAKVLEELRKIIIDRTGIQEEEP